MWETRVIGNLIDYLLVFSPFYLQAIWGMLFSTESLIYFSGPSDERPVFCMSVLSVLGSLDSFSFPPASSSHISIFSSYM